MACMLYSPPPLTPSPLPSLCMCVCVCVFDLDHGLEGVYFLLLFICQFIFHFLCVSIYWYVNDQILINSDGNPWGLADLSADFCCVCCFCCHATTAPPSPIFRRRKFLLVTTTLELDPTRFSFRIDLEQKIEIALSSSFAPHHLRKSFNCHFCQTPCSIRSLWIWLLLKDWCTGGWREPQIEGVSFVTVTWEPSNTVAGHHVLLLSALAARSN